MAVTEYTPSCRPSVSATGVPAWLYALFFFSGISGLLYEVVWLRMLTRILGNTVHATSTVLAAFMAGLAAGSYLAGRSLDRAARPLLWYALLELGIGLAAVLSLGLPDRLLPVYRFLYELAGGSRAWLTAGQVILALAVLLVPTALMGATLPTLCAFGARRQEAFGRCAGSLYALNTLGAVAGVLAGGFILIGEFGETRTVLIGAALNLAVAFGTFVLAPRSPGSRDTVFPPRTPPEQRAQELSGNKFVGQAFQPDRQAGKPDLRADPKGEAPRLRRLVFFCFAAGGFLALANEVVWARLLALYQGTSVYAFSGLLAVLLAGMGGGSWLGGRLVGRWTEPFRVFASLQLATGLAGLVALHLYPLGATARPDLNTGQNLGVLLLAPLVLVGPLGLLSGLAFPAAVRCYTTARATAGRSIAALYAGNTLGGIAGALAGGFVLVPLLGASGSATALAVASFLLGLLLLLRHERLSRRTALLSRPDGSGEPSYVSHFLAGVILWAGPRDFGTGSRLLYGGLTVACALLAVTAGDPYYELLRRQMDGVYPGRVVVYRHLEDATATTTAFGASNSPRDKQLWVNGYGMTTLVPATKLMAHLPLWLADEPRDVLVVCFGMGTAVRSAARHAGLQIWTAELVPGVLECVGCYHPDGPELLRRPNVHTVLDDGRNFLLLNARQYDVITVDPAPPVYSAGTVQLYSREFFQLCHDRLRPGGVACLWVPPANASEVQMVMRTFLDVFEYMSAWEGPAREKGFYLIGHRRPLRDMAARIRWGFRQAAVVEDLAEWGDACDQPEKVLGLHLADGRRLRELVRDARVITDDRPYTEFPLWRALWGGRSYHNHLSGPRLREQLRLLER